MADSAAAVVHQDNLGEVRRGQVYHGTGARAGGGTRADVGAAGRAAGHGGRACRGGAGLVLAARPRRRGQEPPGTS